MKDIAARIGCSERTIRRIIQRGGPAKGKRPRARGSKLDPYKPIIDKCLSEQIWNCTVILRKLRAAGYDGGITLVRNYVQPRRTQRVSKATVRYETEAGQQLQHDWSEIQARIAGEWRRVAFAANTLGFSRVFHVYAAPRQDAEHTYESLVRAFEYFGGVTAEVLVDNQRSAVLGRDRSGVQFNPRFLDLAERYGFAPRACRPYRARTKGKTERVIRYIKENFFAEHNEFESFEHLNRELERWLAQVAEHRIHGTHGESVIERFERAERPELRDLPRERFDTAYRFYRTVGWDGYVDVEGNRYSVHDAFCGETVVCRLTLEQELTVYARGGIEDPREPIARHVLTDPGTGARLDWSVQTAQRRPDDRLLRPAPHRRPGPGEGTVERQQPGPIGDYPLPRPEDWPRRARNLLDAFIDRMRSLQKVRGTLPARAREEALAERDALFEQADALGYPASVVQLALAWGADKLLRDGVKVQTLADYYSRIASLELLGMEEVLDLRDWDDETIEEVTGCVIAARRWSPRSAGHFRTTWFDLLRYGQACGWLAEAEFALSKPREEGAHAPVRTAIVTPAEFEYAYGVLVSREADARYAQWAAALTLGYFAGARASEVCSLSLGDLFVDATECWVEIRSGKSPAARRRIPLHALAPPGPVAQIKGWARRRRQQFPRERAQDVALFGPEGNARGYRYHGLIAPLLDELRLILGEGVDFHLLRHSMVSWLLLRLHAAQYRDFRDQLLERDAWMFSDTALERLRALHQPEGLPGKEGLNGEEWLALAKLVGHRDPGTLLIYYSHSLGPIHSDVLARAWGGRPSRR
ncbi:IS21 family transposase [Halorhodospira halochloris]|nr:IS21 family transposase [Halorhodospira halochloris]